MTQFEPDALREARCPVLEQSRESDVTDHDPDGFLCVGKDHRKCGQQQWAILSGLDPQAGCPVIDHLPRDPLTRFRVGA